MVLQQQISVSSGIVLSSVLFLVVIELSNRFELDQKYFEKKHPRLKGAYGLDLGIFSLVHFVNFAILAVGLSVTIGLYKRTDLTELLVLIMAYAITLILLPFLGIKDYSGHVEDWGHRFSLIVNTLAAAFVMIGAFLMHFAPQTFIVTEFATLLVGSLVYLVGVITGPLFFLSVLASEKINYIE